MYGGNTWMETRLSFLYIRAPSHSAFWPFAENPHIGGATTRGAEQTNPLAWLSANKVGTLGFSKNRHRATAEQAGQRENKVWDHRAHLSTEHGAFSPVLQQSATCTKYRLFSLPYELSKIRLISHGLVHGHTGGGAPHTIIRVQSLSPSNHRMGHFAFGQGAAGWKCWHPLKHLSFQSSKMASKLGNHPAIHLRLLWLPCGRRRSQCNSGRKQASPEDWKAGRGGARGGGLGVCMLVPGQRAVLALGLREALALLLPLALHLHLHGHRVSAALRRRPGVRLQENVQNN